MWNSRIKKIFLKKTEDKKEATWRPSENICNSGDKKP